jgi:hypothetical protein
MSANYPLRHSLQDFGATQRVEERTAIIPPRHDGVIILAIVSVFFAGMASFSLEWPRWRSVRAEKRADANRLVFPLECRASNNAGMN